MTPNRAHTRIEFLGVVLFILLLFYPGGVQGRTLRHQAVVYARFALHQSCGGAAEHDLAANCFMVREGILVIASESRYSPKAGIWFGPTGSEGGESGYL